MGKGKNVDLSTDWSEYVWYDEGYWCSSRQGPSGESEYDYRYPETPQTSQQVLETPRTPGPNVISGTVSSEHALSESGDGPATSELSGSTVYGSSPNYRHFPEATSVLAETSHVTTAPLDTQVPINAAGSSLDDPVASFPERAFVSSSGNPPSSYADDIAATGTLDPSKGNYEAYTLTRPGYYSQNREDDVSAITRGAGALSIKTIPEQGYSGASGSGRQSSFAPIPKYIGKAPNSNTFEELDPRYCQVPKEGQRDFWKVGRVFMMLWTEPAKDNPVPRDGGTRNGSHFSTTYLGGAAYSEIRRFVVMAVGHGNNICSPINTYSGKATLKPNLPEQRQHAMIHTSETPPYEKWYEATDGTIVRENLVKDPIRVKREQPDEEGELNEASRLNYSKLYTVENYVRVLNIGMVHQNSMASLLANSLIQRPEPPQKPRKNPPRADSGGNDRYRNEKGKPKGRSLKESHKNKR